MTSARLISTPAIIGLAATAGLAVAVLGYLTHDGWSAEGAGAAARYTARISFLWFIAAWSASALAALWPGGWRSIMVRRRRAIGLGFAAAHGVHFAALLIAVLNFDAAPSAATIYGGGAGYVLVALMALTSHDAAVRRLGPRNWKRLHLFGATVIAVIFAVSYAGRLGTKPWLAIPALSLLGAVVALKAAAWIKRRTPRLT